MKFLVLPHKVHHQDLSSHGLNDEVLIINFQKEVIDKFLLDLLDGPEREIWEEQLDEVKLFFMESYVLNINGLTAGQNLGILLSFEDFRRYSVKLCFRLVSEEGTPIACGYQKLMLRGKWDNKPRWILRLLMPFFDVTRNFEFKEALTQPSFAQRVIQNDLAEVFSHDVSTIGIMVTQLGSAYSSPKVIDANLVGNGSRITGRGRAVSKVRPKGVPIKQNLDMGQEEMASFPTGATLEGKRSEHHTMRESGLKRDLAGPFVHEDVDVEESEVDSRGADYAVEKIVEPVEKEKQTVRSEKENLSKPSALEGGFVKREEVYNEQVVDKTERKVENIKLAPSKPLEHPPVGEVPVFVFSEFWANQSWILKEVYDKHKELAPYFDKAESIIQEYLGVSLKSMLKFETYDDLTKLFKTFPDFDQVCIFLSEVLLSKILVDQKVVPGAILGYGFGEIPGLVVAGACSFENGVKIVCERIKVLKEHAPSGKMLIVPLTVPQIKKHLSQIDWLTVEIASVNAANQVILSGKENEVLYLQSMLATKGVRCTPIRSVYPFHSSFLDKAAAEFVKKLEGFEFKKSVIPLYLASKGEWFTEDLDVKSVLSDQLKQQMSFVEAIDNVYRKGYRQYIGCSGNKTIPEIIENCVPDNHEGVITTFANKEEGLEKGIENILALKAEGKFKSDIFALEIM